MHLVCKDRMACSYRKLCAGYRGVPGLSGPAAEVPGGSRPPACRKPLPAGPGLPLQQPVRRGGAAVWQIRRSHRQENG